MPVVSHPVFRMAPARDGVIAADAWRFWKSGDEFYAGVRKATHLSKLSFHRDGKWQLQTFSKTHRLPATRHISPEWTLVISLQWMILADSFQPNSTGQEKVLLIDVPLGYRLCLDLLVSRTTTQPRLPEAEPAGEFVWEVQLRSGRRLAINKLLLPWTDAEVQDALRIRHESAVHIDKTPARGSHYAEIAWFRSRPSTGNVVWIVPHGPNEVLVRPSS